MSDTSFASVLDRPADDIKRPPPLPRGTYLCIVDGQPVKREVGAEKTPAWDFTLKILQPQPDVDPQEISDAGGVAGKTVRVTFFETEAAAWRLVRFLKEHLGIDSSGKTARQLISEAPGHQVIATIKQTPSKDGSEMYANVDSTAHA